MSFNGHFSSYTFFPPFSSFFYCLDNFNATYCSHFCVWVIFRAFWFVCALELSTFRHLSLNFSDFGASCQLFRQFKFVFMWNCSFHYLKICVWVIFTLFGLFVHWNYQLSVTSLRISPTSGFLSSFVFIWNRSFHFLKLFGVLFLCFYHHFPLGEYDNFCVLLTFGVTFWYLEIFFSWNGWIKVDKNARKYGKVSRPGLYKRNLLVQERPSIQQVCYSTSCFLFIVTCYTWQVWSNAAKRVQMRWTFADGIVGRFVTLPNTS